jgi:murein DD-endopeptidase MepM/ murein hydrolase activator NlpD
MLLKFIISICLILILVDSIISYIKTTTKQGSKTMRFRKKRDYKYLYIISTLLISVSMLYVFNSSYLERDNPNIIFKSSKYWNLKDDLQLSINDASGIKAYKVVLSDSKNDILLDSKSFEEKNKNIDIKIPAPNTSLFFDKENIKITIEATDFSKWNFLSGNKATKEISMLIDNHKPKVEVISSTFGIKRGGSGIAIFKVEDKNLKDIYIKTSYGKKFQPIKFYKEGYYTSLVVWPVWEDKFKTQIIATDLAGNKKVTKLSFYLKNRKYRTSHIQLKDKFLNGKITSLYEDFNNAKTADNIQKFKYINEDEREKNEKYIHDITSKVYEEKIDDFSFNTLYPLKNSAVVATFGDKRIFYRNKKSEQTSRSYHLGLDLASIKHANIVPQNESFVVSTKENGIYGDMLALYHKFGIYTIYGHCSNINVSVGEKIKAKEVVAQTGKTGLAFGDHLHFGVLIQGVETRPQEWMDKKWIKTHITDVIDEAKKYIDKKS